MQIASDDSAPVRMNRPPMTSTVDELGARGFTASSRPDNQTIFLRAKRHSRMVRMLRIAVPLGTGRCWRRSR